MTYVQYIIISRVCPDHVVILARNARNYDKFSNEFPVNDFYVRVLLDRNGSPSSMASLHGNVSKNKLGRMVPPSSPARLLTLYRKIRFLNLPVWGLEPKKAEGSERFRTLQ